MLSAPHQGHLFFRLWQRQSDPDEQMRAEGVVPGARSAWDAPDTEAGQPSTGIWDPRSDAVAKGSNEVPAWQMMVRSGTLFFLAALDNGLAYGAYAVAQSFGDRLYNIVDVHMALLPGLGASLLIFALLGTLVLLAVVAFVGFGQLPGFERLMTIRLYCSTIPCALACAVLLYTCEETEVVPQFALLACLLSVIAWAMHIRLCLLHRLSTTAKLWLDFSWIASSVVGVTLLLLFAANGMDVLTSSGDLSCPFARNTEMPVQVRLLSSWHCVPWGSSSQRFISRSPVNNALPQALSCSDTFVSAFGTSLAAHAFSCPPGCAMNSTGNAIFGCGIYTLDSLVCEAGIHAGAVTDDGGTGVVYGRLGLPEFESCSMNSLQSSPRSVAAVGASATVVEPGSYDVYAGLSAGGGRRLTSAPPEVLDAFGNLVPQAFHFNTLASTREYIWLKRWQQSAEGTDGIDTGKPWTRFEGVVSARVAGLEIQDEGIRLGNTPDVPALSSCSLESDGLVCSGSGDAMLRLDFCDTNSRTCLG